MSCCCSPKTNATTTVTDPVCGMAVNPETTSHKSEYNGTSYAFCGESCKTKFDATPEKYVTAAASCCA